MKSFSIFLLALVFAGCKNEIKQRDEKISASIMSYVNDLITHFPGSHSKVPGKIDGLKIISVDSITESKRLGMEINFIHMEIDSIPMMQMKGGQDSAWLKKSSNSIQQWNKQIDSINAIKASDQFWGFYVKTKIYSHGFGEGNAEDDKMFFYTSKDFKTEVDAKQFFAVINKR